MVKFKGKVVDIVVVIVEGIPIPIVVGIPNLIVEGILILIEEGIPIMEGILRVVGIDLNMEH